MNYRVNRDNFKEVFEKVKTNDIIYFRDISFIVQKNSNSINFSVKGKKIISIIIVCIAISLFNAFIGYFINFYREVSFYLYILSFFIAGVFSQDITRLIFNSQINKFSNICKRWNEGENNNHLQKCKIL